MNPFLVGVTILCWAIFICSMLCSYLSTTEESTNNCGWTAFFFFVFAVFSTIAAGAQWQQIYGHH